MSEVNGPSAVGAVSIYSESLEALDADPTTQLAAMMLDQARERRDANRGERRMAEDSIRELEKKQVDQLKKQAAEAREAGRRAAIGQIVGGAMKVAGGAMQIGSGAAQAHSARAAAGARSPTASMETRNASNSAAIDAQFRSDALGGAASSLSGGGELAAGWGNMSATNPQARADKAGIAATAAGQAADRVKRGLEDLNAENGVSRDLEEKALLHARSASELRDQAERAKVWRA